MNGLIPRLLSITRTERYAIAVLGVLLTGVLRLALDPILQDNLPFLLFMFPVILASWAGGLWPGLLAIGLSLLLADYLFMAPRGSLFRYETPDFIRALAWVSVGTTFAILFDRIRKGLQAHLTDRQSAEEKMQFLGNLNDAFQLLTDPEEIMDTAVHMLGEHLCVDRCGYAEVEADEDHFVIKGNYTRGTTKSIVGRYCMSDFGENERQILLKNQPYVVDDVEAEAPTGTNLSLYRRGEIRAMVCVPLSRHGKFIARMAVQQSTPRHWSEQEIQLIATVASRCWESVERARALRSLQESDERYRAFIANSSEAIWRFELEQSIPINLPEEEQLELLFRHAYLAECNDAMARMYGYSSRDQILGARLSQLVVAADPQNLAFFRAIKQAGYRLTDIETHEVDRHGNTKYFLNNTIGILENQAVVRAWGTQRDITTQKEAEEALRASEERYRLLTELSPDGVVIADSTGIIHLANPSMSRMLRARPEQLTGQNLFDMLSPEFVDGCRDCMESLMQDPDPSKHVDAAFRTRNNMSFPAEINAVRFDWKGQRFAQIVIHDLTRRQEAEVERERLLWDIESERNRLRQILEQMPIGVAIAEAPGGRMIFHNVEAIRLLGHPLLASEDYRGFAQYGAEHGDGRPYLAEEYPMARSLLSANVIKGEEFKYRRGDGTYTILSVDSAPIFDPQGRMVLVIATFIDIAERKRNEEALRKSEERFAKAFQAAPDGLVLSRISDGVILEANDSFSAMTGYSRDELIGKSTISLELYADPKARLRILEQLKEKNCVRDFEFELRRKSGEIRVLTFSAEPFDLRGEHCWLTIGRDVTEQKQAELERDRLLLQEKVARENAEAASRLKDEFLATISHELRTPLTSILGWARLLSSGSLSASQTQRALRVIEHNAKSQARLVDDILDTSRITTGRYKLDLRPIHIDGIFQAAVDVIRPSAETKRITLRAMIEERGSIVLGDASRLQQAIWNLLSNAVKFTNEGGTVEARLSRNNAQVEISIRDTGMGIEADFLPFVFDRFRQADSTSTRRYGGLGLGLAIVRHVVELHGGSVSASSSGKGHGSTFVIKLPLAAAKPLSAKAKGEPPTPQLKQHSEKMHAEQSPKLNGRRVLVVEDDPDTLDMIRFILDKSGAEVISVKSTSEALQALEGLLPDALVSDLAMPGQDGYELIGQVRSREPQRGGNVPAVALSAYTGSEDRVRALAAGFQRHVPKPVDPEELVDVVASLTSTR